MQTYKPMNRAFMSLFTTLLITVGISTASAQDFEFHYHTDFPKILGQTQDSLSPLHFKTLLPRFQANDTTLTDYEVLALLIGFTTNPEFKPYAYLSTERDIYALNGSGEYRKALAECDSFLGRVPVSQSANVEKSFAFYKLNMPDSSDYYMWKHARIMHAMDRTGDGLSLETAIFSLGPADGQDYIRRYLRGRIGTMGSGADKNGDFVDILWYTPEKAPEGFKEIPLYFQIQHAAKRMFNFEDQKRIDELPEPDQGKGK